MNVINYVEEKKKVLKERLATKVVMGKDFLTQKPTAVQKESIEDLMESDTWIT
jgi:hypothetical protein